MCVCVQLGFEEMQQRSRLSNGEEEEREGERAEKVSSVCLPSNANWCTPKSDPP